MKKAETVDTYTITPTSRSVFSPENIDTKGLQTPSITVKNTGQTITVQQISTTS